MTIHLVTAANAGYFEKIKPYLKTLNENGRGLKVWFVAVNAQLPEWLSEYPNIEGREASTNEKGGSPKGTESLQHGGWLGCIPAEDDDTVVFTDGDIFLQRPLGDTELKDLDEWGNNTIGASYNMGPDETLLIEAIYKLQPQITDGEFFNIWGRACMTATCLNVGVLVAKRKTFLVLHKLYMQYWELISQHLKHQARQQWLIAWVAYNYGMDVQILPYSFHTHGHFTLPNGIVVGKAGDAYANGVLVAFWHVPMWARK